MHIFSVKIPYPWFIIKIFVSVFYSAFPAWDRELMHKKDIHKKLLDPKTRSTSGCTCTGVLLTPQHIIVFNVGDSRTLILNENHKENDMILFATKDHKPDDPEETARIEKSGGFVTLPPRTYIPRVNGQLALSRAFGDFQLKMSKTAKQHEQAVIVDPDVTIFKRSEATHIGE
jgi:serine/threonine protein phosphatase PrpC